MLYVDVVKILEKTDMLYVFSEILMLRRVQ